MIPDARWQPVKFPVISLYNVANHLRFVVNPIYSQGLYILSVVQHFFAPSISGQFSEMWTDQKQLSNCIGENVPFKTISVLWKSLGFKEVPGWWPRKFKVGILRLSTSGTSVVADSSLHGLDICCLVVGNKRPKGAAVVGSSDPWRHYRF